MPASDSGSERARGRTPEELETQLGFLEDEIGDLRRRLAESPVHSRALEQRLAETQRSLAAVTAQNERLAQTLREARDQIMTLKEEVDRLAQPPAGFGTFLARNDDDSIDVFTGGRKLRVNVSPTVDLDDLRKGQEVMLNEALNVVAAMEFEQVGEVVMLKEILADGERVLVHRQRRRGARRAPRRPAARADPARRRLAAARRALRLRLRAGAQVRGRGARPRRGPRHRLREHRRPEGPDRPDPRRGRAALPPPRPVHGARAQAAQGRAALRPARLRQDADRQGGRQLAGQEGRGQDRPGGEELLPQHQGPRAAQQVRRRDRASHPAGVPAGPREGQQGHAGHRVLRRDGLAVPHPRLRRLLRRGEHHRPAAAQRDRRRRGPGERHRHRRVQPRGHDRPGDPAPRPPRREDQDRASRRGVRARHLLQVPHPQAAAARRGPRPSSATTATPAWPG